MEIQSFKFLSTATYAEIFENEEAQGYISLPDALAFKSHAATRMRPTRTNNANVIAVELHDSYNSGPTPRFFDSNNLMYIWSGVRQIHPEFPEEICALEKAQAPRQVDKLRVALLRRELFDQLFAPLIPDLPLVEYVLNDHSNRLIKVIAFICLIIEALLRIVVCLFVAFALCLYSLKNRNASEYYRFRLYFNMLDPAIVIFQKFMTSCCL